MSKRQCGECQLCCKLLPVKAVDKKGGETCKHQCATGCAVYEKLPTVSPECRIWTCGWLLDGVGELERPDKSHIVVDVMPDFVGIPGATGTVINVTALQVWIDPDHKDAHRDPKLRNFLNDVGKQHGACAIIRYGPSEGFVLLPPSLTSGNWYEDHTPPVERTHTAAEVFDVVKKVKAP